jgi:protein KRI1
MKEIRAKLEEIGREGGKNLDDDPGESVVYIVLPFTAEGFFFSTALQELDLEGDWDPEAHDRQMAGLYGNDDLLDDEKPQWDDDIDIGGIAVSDDEEPSKKNKKKKKKKKDKEDEAVDQGVDIDAMDADVERIVDGEEWDGTEEMRKKKLDEYMDEIYGLDFNDLVRFQNLIYNEMMLLTMFYRLGTCQHDSSTSRCNRKTLR